MPTNINIVFLHGWGMNKGVWQPFLNLCEQKWECTINLEALDLPGFGLNYQNHDTAYTINDVSDAVARQLNPNTILVGWSLGGLVAQHLADSKHPHLVAHVQLASTPKFTQSKGWVGIKAEVLQSFADEITSNHEALLKRFLAIQCMGLNKPKLTMKIMLDAVNKLPLSSVETLSKSLSLLRETDLRPRAPEEEKDSLPCLRIFGALDGLVPKRAIENISMLYPHSKTIVLPKASHAPFVSHPDQCISAIDDFLSEL